MSKSKSMRQVEAEITIWYLPHKAYGNVMTIDLEAEGDDRYFLYTQSLEYRKVGGEKPYLDIDFPHEKLPVSEKMITQLGVMIEGFQFEFDEPEYPTKLGSTEFGIEILRGFQTLTIQWSGNEGPDNPAKEIFGFVQSLQTI